MMQGKCHRWTKLLSGISATRLYWNLRHACWDYNVFVRLSEKNLLDDAARKEGGHTIAEIETVEACTQYRWAMLHADGSPQKKFKLDKL